MELIILSVALFQREMKITRKIQNLINNSLSKLVIIHFTLQKTIEQETLVDEEKPEIIMRNYKKVSFSIGGQDQKF